MTGVVMSGNIAGGMKGSVFPKLLYGREEASELLSISVRMLDYLIAGKQIAVVRIGNRLLISRKELERFARRGCTSAEKIN